MVLYIKIFIMVYSFVAGLVSNGNSFVHNDVMVAKYMMRIVMVSLYTIPKTLRIAIIKLSRISILNVNGVQA